MNHPRCKPALALALLASMAMTGCPGDETTDTLRIGVLLPYTRRQGPMGSNVELALVMVQDAVNAAGGIHGRQVELVYRDTHSSADRGLQGARRLVLEEKVAALVTASENGLDSALLPLLAENDVLAISGGVTSPTLGQNGPNDRRCFLSTSPTTVNLAYALADRLAADGGIGSASLVYVNDQTGRDFAGAVQRRWVNQGTATPCAELPDVGASPDGGMPPAGDAGIRVSCVHFEDGDSLGAAVSILANHPTDAYVLAAYPLSGAELAFELLLQNSSLAGWYASPDLRSESFLQNAPPGSAEGLVGVSNATPVALAAFRGRYADRWSGVQAMTSTLYYYDALALLLLGMEATPGGQGTGCVALRDQVIGVSHNGTGLGVAWQELDKALSYIRNGQKISYLGVSSNAGLTSQGSIASGLAQFWRVESGDVVDTELVFVE